MQLWLDFVCMIVSLTFQAIFTFSFSSYFSRSIIVRRCVLTASNKRILYCIVSYVLYCVRYSTVAVCQLFIKPIIDWLIDWFIDYYRAMLRWRGICCRREPGCVSITSRFRIEKTEVIELLTWTFPSTYPTLSCKEIWVSAEIRVLLLRTLSQTPDWEN